MRRCPLSGNLLEQESTVSPRPYPPPEMSVGKDLQPGGGDGSAYEKSVWPHCALASACTQYKSVPLGVHTGVCYRFQLTRVAGLRDTPHTVRRSICRSTVDKSSLQKGGTYCQNNCIVANCSCSSSFRSNSDQYSVRLEDGLRSAG